VAVVVAQFERERTTRVWDGRAAYRGLKPYDETDDEFFFGREQLVNAMLNHLCQSRFLCVAGPSGSGKSSLVRAGLLPAIRQGRLSESQKWKMTTLVPGRSPLVALASAVARVTGNPDASVVSRK
jgi:energy-coupling factor transporter ATP-binding protein EcfA2